MADSIPKQEEAFMKLVRILITGEVDKVWLHHHIGPITKARAVRRCLSKENSSFNFFRIVNYLVYVWAEIHQEEQQAAGRAQTTALGAVAH